MGMILLKHCGIGNARQVMNYTNKSNVIEISRDMRHVT